jgi:hypothetical protein
MERKPPIAKARKKAHDSVSKYTAPTLQISFLRMWLNIGAQLELSRIFCGGK